mgnify:CR=1 FL=1
MSTKREIKYDAADHVKLNDEVNVDLEDKHHGGVGTTSDGLCGSSSIKGSALSLIHISEPTIHTRISLCVLCL